MKQKLLNIKECGLPKVKSGKAVNVDEFFDKVIENQFKHRDEIKKIHNTLMQYITNDNAVFVLRLFGSDSKKRYNNLRRGFLTIYPDGHKMVFCDNTFAMPFAAIKFSGQSYTEDDLMKYMNDPSTKYGFGMTSEERELAFYQWNSNKSNINLNTYGWYLAHIVPVGKDYSGKTLRDFFENPKRTEWETEEKVRYANNELTDEELAILKAHFIRMIHPLNSFLVPKRSLLAYDGKNIGEEPELISFVQDYIQNEFRSEYAELKKIMQIPTRESFTPHISGIIWNEYESTIKKVKSAPINDKKIVPLKQKDVPTEVYDNDEEYYLEKTLRSIGKSTFLKLYPLVKNNQSISIKEVSRLIPEYKDYKSKSQISRLSNTKSIIRLGLDREALTNIISSQRINKSDRQTAETLLAQYL